MPGEERFGTIGDALLYGATGRTRQGLEDRAAAGFGALDPLQGARQDRAVHSVASEDMARRFGPTVAQGVGDAREFFQGVGQTLRGRPFFGDEGFDPRDQAANDAGIARAGQRTVVAPLPDTSTVTTTESDFRAVPPAAPAVPLVPTFLQPPPTGGVVGRPPSTFDDAFDDFFGDRNNNTSGSAFFDPFAGGDPYGDPTFDTVDTGTYGNREGLPEFDDEGQGSDPEHESGINPAALTPEEQAFVDEENRKNRRDIYGQDPVLMAILGGGGGGGAGGWFPEAF